MANCFVASKRFFSTTQSKWNNVFNHVTIIGGGLMGSGIAQVTAQSGIDVTIVEVNEEAVRKSNSNIKTSIQRVAKKLFQNNSEDAQKYISESMGRLKISLDLKESVANTDLVVEAIVEDINAKHNLFSKIDSLAPPHTIFTSNTSSLSITDIAAVTKRKDRFGGLHFFNPVPVMKLLEVIRTKDTSEETYQKMMAWGKAIGKTTITCTDTPGFVVNRLLIPYLAEAIRMLERGDASAKDIDVAMKLGAGYPMGPLELLDYVGLDTTKFILDGWHKKYPTNPLFSPINTLQKLVADGKLGKKTGEGFYSYKKNPRPVSFSHFPYFQPLPASNTVISNSASSLNPTPNQEENSVKLQCKADKLKKPKFKKEVSNNSNGNYQEPKVGKLGKLNKLEKLENIEKRKNSLKLFGFEKDNMLSKKNMDAQQTKLIENRLSKIMLKNVQKSKNLEDFVKFERERY